MQQSGALQSNASGRHPREPRARSNGEALRVDRVEISHILQLNQRRAQLHNHLPMPVVAPIRSEWCLLHGRSSRRLLERSLLELRSLLSDIGILVADVGERRAAARTRQDQHAREAQTGQELPARGVPRPTALHRWFFLHRSR
jgi:hypothetical protein